VHFLPVLEPLLTAPMWLLGGTATAYHAIQLENAFVMSLAAVPAYLIARRLRLSAPVSLGVAALAVAGPQLALSAMILSEPFAYPLALAVVAVALRALETPTRRTQALLLLLCGAAVLTRLQLAALPVCVLAALVASGWREHGLRRTLRELDLFVGALVGVGVVGAAAALSRGFGYYSGLAHPAPAGAVAHTVGIDAFVVLICTGIAIVPSALPGLALGLARPRFRAEFAFSVLVTSLAVAFLAEAALWEHASRVQTRYLCYLLPLLAVAFGLRRSRSERHALAEVAVAAVLATVAAAVPLDGWSKASDQSVSVGLAAMERLTVTLHGPAAAAGAFAIAITVLGAAGAVCARLRHGTLAAFGLSVAASVLLLALSAAWIGGQERGTRAAYLPADSAWVDDATDGRPASMLVVGQATEAPSLATLFWNPSVERVVRTPGAHKIGNLQTPVVSVAGDGTVRLHGAPLAGPLVLETDFLTAVRFQNATRVGKVATTSLWDPAGPVRLRTIMTGRFADGRVLRSGAVALWRRGRLDGWIELSVRVPVTLPRAAVTLRGGGRTASVTVAPGGRGLLRVAACEGSPWRGGFSTTAIAVAHNRWRSPLLGTPRYVADPRACS
jgi:hypothetical protein